MIPTYIVSLERLLLALQYPFSLFSLKTELLTVKWARWNKDYISQVPITCPWSGHMPKFWPVGCHEPCLWLKSKGMPLFPFQPSRSLWTVLSWLELGLWEGINVLRVVKQDKVTQIHNPLNALPASAFLKVRKPLLCLLRGGSWDTGWANPY